ncbi:MAG TPA: OmpA family protein [Bacteroidia bacterium]|jgi:OOP family OmpA-OmpF porin|nr:OmpA family protein [Bacteroidia bacterium]
MSKFWTLVFFVISWATFYAQTIITKNLVPNGGFENYRKKGNNLKNAIPWRPVSSVDYYQETLKNDVGACKGAHTGECCAGLRYQKKYKEFIEVKLSESLKHGNVYQFECYLRLAFWSNAMLKSFGVYISKGGMKAVNFPERECVVDTVTAKGGLNGELCWFRVKGSYRAAGGEKFITVGNFSPNLKADMIKINAKSPGFKEAYYFIDDVSLKWMKPKDEVRTVYVDSLKYESDSVLQVKNNLQTGEKITLKVSFELGKSNLLPESYSELNKLSQYLFRHQNFVIKIDGHSDNSGSKSKNQKLSEQRARAVFEYLITHGVQNKMYYQGYGSSLPIADNETEDGKAKNRRVEFEIVRQ